MTEKMPSCTYIFVDRRKSGKGKSLQNRQRLLKRIQDAIRSSKPTDIDADGIKNVHNNSGAVNPVSVANDCLYEPTFHYAAGTGEYDVVLIGNDHWERGDEFPTSQEGEGEGEGTGGPGEDSEDDFIVNVSRDEFFNVFFEDCELPDMRETIEREIPEMLPKHAGFQKEGNPAQLSVSRSYKNAFPRKRALTRDAKNELLQLENELSELLKGIK